MIFFLKSINWLKRHIKIVVDMIVMQSKNRKWPNPIKIQNEWTKNTPVTRKNDAKMTRRTKKNNKRKRTVSRTEWSNYYKWS